MNLAQAMRKQVLVFPFDSAAITAPFAADIAELLTDKAVSRFLASGAYTVTAYRKTLPTIIRLNSDQQLTETDISAPFSEDARKPVKVAKAAQYDLAFVGSIDEYQYDDTKKEASVTGTGRLIEVETGKVLKSGTFSATGSGPASAKENERAAMAARGLGDKIMAEVVPIVGVQVQTTTTPKPEKSAPKPKKKRGGEWLWGLLAVGLGLGLGLSGRSGGGGLDGPPAPPAR